MTGPSPRKPGAAAFSLVRFLVAFALAAASPAPAWARSVPRSFDFKIFTADIFAYDPYEDSSHPHAMARSLREVLINAESSLNLAIYGMRNQPWFEETLKEARQRQVRIQAVVDQNAGKLGEWETENFYYPDTAKLGQILGRKNVQPDITSSGTIRRSIMHNKFLVVDQRYVWTGSTNLSDTCIGQEINANVSLLVDSPELAMAFDREFTQMFHNKRFSLAKKHDPAEVLEFADGTRVTPLFSPQHSPVDHAVLPLIENTRRKLDLAIFFLTEPRIVDALGRAAQRGVKIRIIHDGLAAAHPQNRLEALRSAGIEVRVENWMGKMHMKAAVADGVNVLLGSMNWSQSGNLKNDENTLWIENNRTLAHDMTVYFDRLWNSLESTDGNKGALGMGFQDGVYEMLRRTLQGNKFYPAA